MFKNKTTTSILIGGMSLAGLAAGVATMASAQTLATTTTPNQGAYVVKTIDAPESANDPADTDTGSKERGHSPLGGDGTVSSISGTTIVISEESNEGGASYTVDASKATVTNNGAAATLTDVKVGAKVFVQGAVNGTSVSATSISLGGHHGIGHKEANDTDGGAASEASEGTSTSDASDQ